MAHDQWAVIPAVDVASYLPYAGFQVLRARVVQFAFFNFNSFGVLAFEVEQVLGAGYVDLLRLEGRIYSSVEDRLGYKPT